MLLGVCFSFSTNTVSTNGCGLDGEVFMYSQGPNRVVRFIGYLGGNCGGVDAGVEGIKLA